MAIINEKRMKSIKEKSEENCIKYGNLGNVAYQEFEAGAKYVLEEIEKLLPKNKRCLNDYGKALIWRLEDKIKQLKEK